MFLCTYFIENAIFIITKNQEECIEASNLFYLIKMFNYFVRKFGCEKKIK